MVAYNRNLLTLGSWVGGMQTRIKTEELPSDALRLIENFLVTDTGSIKSRRGMGICATISSRWIAHDLIPHFGLVFTYITHTGKSYYNQQIYQLEAVLVLDHTKPIEQRRQFLYIGIPSPAVNTNVYSNNRVFSKNGDDLYFHSGTRLLRFTLSSRPGKPLPDFHNIDHVNEINKYVLNFTREVAPSSFSIVRDQIRLVASNSSYNFGIDVSSLNVNTPVLTTHTEVGIGVVPMGRDVSIRICEYNIETGEESALSNTIDTGYFKENLVFYNSITVDTRRGSTRRISTPDKPFYTQYRYRSFGRAGVGRLDSLHDHFTVHNESINQSENGTFWGYMTNVSLYGVRGYLFKRNTNKIIAIDTASPSTSVSSIDPDFRPSVLPIPRIIISSTITHEVIVFRFDGVDLDKFSSKMFVPEIKQPLPVSGQLVFYRGRAWSYVDNILHYSAPGQYGYSNVLTYFTFPAKIKLISEVNTGIYVVTIDKTYFLQGDDPKTMVLKEVFPQSGVAGTSLTAPAHMFASSEEGTPTGEKYAYWMADRGAVLGMPDGSVVPIMQDKIEVDTRQIPFGSSAVVNRDGINTIHTVYREYK